MPNSASSNASLLFLHPSAQLEGEVGCPRQRIVGDLHLGVRPQELEQAVDGVVRRLSIPTTELAAPLQATLRDLQSRRSTQLAPALGKEVTHEVQSGL